MSNFFKRIRNLWRLSEYKIDSTPELLDKRFKTLTKDFPTIQKKPATIIPEVEKDLLSEDIDIQNA